MNLDREFSIKWLAKLRKYWIEKDIDGAVSLFSKTKSYYETPFLKPFTTQDEIKKEWQHVKDEDIKDVRIELLAVDGDTVIAHWILVQNNEAYDGIYEIKFDDNLDCIYFKSWEMSQNML